MNTWIQRAFPDPEEQAYAAAWMKFLRSGYRSLCPEPKDASIIRHRVLEELEREQMQAP